MSDTTQAIIIIVAVIVGLGLIVGGLFRANGRDSDK